MATRTHPTRRSLRLPHYDYSRAGFYFVTVVTRDRGSWFGQIVDAEMQANEAGRMVADVWRAMSSHYIGVGADTFVLMPDHVHGIVTLNSSHDRTLSLPDVVHRFKTMTTAQYIEGVKTRGWPRFRSHLWRRGYYDRVVRSERALQEIRNYIVGNPRRWWVRSGPARRPAPTGNPDVRP
jgi:REP element-mobilizing transposase RayT